MKTRGQLPRAADIKLAGAGQQYFCLGIERDSHPFVIEHR
jgi:hypothetical protein